MSDEVYFTIQLTKTLEVCVKASTPNEAAAIAKEGDFDWTMADVSVDEVEDLDDGEDSSGAGRMIQEFKDEQRYAE